MRRASDPRRLCRHGEPRDEARARRVVLLPAHRRWWRTETAPPRLASSRHGVRAGRAHRAGPDRRPLGAGRRRSLREIPDGVDIRRIAAPEPPSGGSRGRLERVAVVPQPWSRWWAENVQGLGAEAGAGCDLIWAVMQPYQSAEPAAALAARLGGAVGRRPRRPLGPRRDARLPDGASSEAVDAPHAAGARLADGIVMMHPGGGVEAHRRLSGATVAPGRSRSARLGTG